MSLDHHCNLRDKDYYQFTFWRSGKKITQTSNLDQSSRILIKSQVWLQHLDLDSHIILPDHITLKLRFNLFKESCGKEGRGIDKATRERPSELRVLQVTSSRSIKALTNISCSSFVTPIICPPKKQWAVGLVVYFGTINQHRGSEKLINLLANK